MAKRILASIALILPAFFVFKALFLSKVLFGGDAPFFYPEAFNDLLTPVLYTERGISFGGFSQLFWLTPVMFLYGTMGKFLNLGNDAILRILFLFPSLILSFLGPIFLTRYLKLSKIVQFFASFVYVFNTYYILIVDGGQVGVVLAYGIFPFLILFLKKLVDTKSKSAFVNALLISFVMCLVDPRIFAIAFLVVFVWGLMEAKFSLTFFSLLLIVIAFNVYWLLPIFSSGQFNIPNTFSDLKIVSIINPLLIFSPHWPNNVFGKVVEPPFYFIFVPALILWTFSVYRKNKNLTFLFLIFSLMSAIPLGWMLRDPTKFFMPVVLFAGILIGLTIEKVPRILPIVYLFVLFLVFPALSGKLNFLLSNQTPEVSYEIIHSELVKDESEFRTLWFTKKHPLSFETLGKPAIDATDLVNFRPFAAMNTGEDSFNFLNSPNFTDWWKVLGVKYVFLNGDARNIFPTDTDLRNWGVIKSLVGGAPALERKNWQTNFDVFEVLEAFPKTFFADRLVAVIGPDLDKTTPAIYFEDGKWNPERLRDVNPDSVKMFFNDKKEIDLTMSLLQRFFVPADKSISNYWAIYSSNQYLKYKYELLIRDFKFNDFDYDKGIAFSSIKGETIRFKFGVPTDGKYILALRVADIENQNLEWKFEEKDLLAGQFEYEVINDKGLKVLNIIALVPNDEFERATDLSRELVRRFGKVSYYEIKDAEHLASGRWKITTTNFGGKSFPVFSMVNGYYNE